MPLQQRCRRAFGGTTHLSASQNSGSLLAGQIAAVVQSLRSCDRRVDSGRPGFHMLDDAGDLLFIDERTVHASTCELQAAEEHIAWPRRLSAPLNR